MNEPKSDTNPDFTVKFSEFIEAFLGDSHSKPVPDNLLHLVPAIKAVARKTLICHVREADEWDPLICRPIIYRYSKWIEDSDRWLKQKRRSDKERDDRFIFEYNVKLIAKFLNREYQYDMDKGLVIGFSWLKTNSALLKVFHPTFKPITKIEQIQ